MPPLEDVSGALRAVWEVRRAEERLAYCIGAWHNIVFGLMASTIFASYTAVAVLGLDGPWVRWLWLPPLLAAYTGLAFITKTVLRLPRPTLPWGEVAVGTTLFVVLLALLGLGVANGVVRDLSAGMSLVIGCFYIILGLVFLREPAPSLFGAAVAAGALALLLSGAGPAWSAPYGIFAVGGGMVAMGAWMLRHPEHGGPPRDAAAAGGPPGEASELRDVRETLAGLRGHEARVRAREQAAKTFLAAAVFALAGVVGLLGGAHPEPLALLAVAGLTALLGLWRQRSEAGHGA